MGDGEVWVCGVGGERNGEWEKRVCVVCRDGDVTDGSKGCGAFFFIHQFCSFRNIIPSCCYFMHSEPKSFLRLLNVTSMPIEK